MKIGSIGYNYSHDASFVMDRPNGIGCFLLLLIKEPSVFEINGEHFNVSKNSFVIFTPQTPCLYKAAGKTYCDDWIFFDCDERDYELFKRLGITLNTIIHLGDLTELSKIIHILAYEHYSAEPLHDEIERKYIDILFLRLSQCIKTKSSGCSEALVKKNYRFTQLRNLMYTAPESIPDVSEMAAQLNMSRSAFQHLYKKIFGTSVINDVINGRLNKAKRLLSSTNLTIKEIAEKCGYSNEYNFMRQFKSRLNMTPTEYRKML